MPKKIGKLIGGATKSKSQSEPWKEAQPYLEDTLERAGQLFDNGNLSPNHVGLGGVTRQGLTDIGNLARNNPVTAAATGSLGDFLGAPAYNSGNIGVGAVAGPQSYGGIPQNFGIDAVRESVLDTALPEVAGMFGRGGLVNSTSAMAAAGDAIASRLAPYEFDQVNRNQQLGLNQFNTEQDRRLGFDVNERNIGLNQANLNSDRAFDQYSTQRQQQLGGLSLAPSINALAQGDAQNLYNVGTIYDQNRAALRANPSNEVNAAANLFSKIGALGTSQTNTPSALDSIGKVGQTATGLFKGFA